MKLIRNRCEIINFEKQLHQFVFTEAAGSKLNPNYNTILISFDYHNNHVLFYRFNYYISK